MDIKNSLITVRCQGRNYYCGASSVRMIPQNPQIFHLRICTNAILEHLETLVSRMPKDQCKLYGLSNYNGTLQHARNQCAELWNCVQEAAHDAWHRDCQAARVGHGVKTIPPTQHITDCALLIKMPNHEWEMHTDVNGNKAIAMDKMVPGRWGETLTVLLVTYEICENDEEQAQADDDFHSVGSTPDRRTMEPSAPPGDERSRRSSKCGGCRKRSGSVPTRKEWQDKQSTMEPEHDEKGNVRSTSPVKDDIRGGDASKASPSDTHTTSSSAARGRQSQSQGSARMRTPSPYDFGERRASRGPGED